MNIAIDLPDEVATLVETQSDQQGFLIEAIQREWQRRKALSRLMQLSEQVSARSGEMNESQLEALVDD